MPMQNILLLAKLKAYAVCPCRIYYFWQNWGHWACVHAEYITFGRTEGMCAHADCISGDPGQGGGGDVGETRATRWTLRPPRCGDVQPSLAGAAVSGASGGIGSRHSDTRHQTPALNTTPNGQHFASVVYSQTQSTPQTNQNAYLQYRPKEHKTSFLPFPSPQASPAQNQRGM